MRAALFSFVCKQSKPLGHPQEWTQDKSQIFSFEVHSIPVGLVPEVVRQHASGALQG